MKLTKIWVENFKSHIDSWIEPKKITVLIGPTNSGKSTILQSLLILKRTLSRDESQFVTKGETYDYGDFEDIVTEGDIKKNLSVSIQGIKQLNKYLPLLDEMNTNFFYSASSNKQNRRQVKLRVDIGVLGIDFTYPESEDLKTKAWDTRISKNLAIQSSDLNGFNPRLHVVTEGGLSRTIIDGLFRNGDYTKKLLDDYYYIPFSRAITAYSLPIEHSTDFISTNLQKSSSALLSRISADPKLKRKISRYISMIGNKSIESRNVKTRGDERPQLTLEFVYLHFLLVLVKFSLTLLEILDQDVFPVPQ